MFFFLKNKIINDNREASTHAPLAVWYFTPPPFIHCLWKRLSLSQGKQAKWTEIVIKSKRKGLLFEETRNLGRLPNFDHVTETPQLLSIPHPIGLLFVDLRQERRATNPTCFLPCKTWDLQFVVLFAARGAVSTLFSLFLCFTFRDSFASSFGRVWLWGLPV